MNGFDIILKKLIEFAIILLIGYIAARRKIITDESLAMMSRMVSKLLLPIFISINIVQDGSRQQLFENSHMILWTILIYGTLIIAMKLVAKCMQMDREHGNVFEALFVFGCVGFIGIPLLFALYPTEGPMYMAWFTLMDQPLLWIYGVYLTSGRSSIKLKQMLNPAVVGVLIAVLIIVLEIPVPHILVNTLRTVGGISVPFCMLYLGAMIYVAKPMGILKKPELYVGVAVRMLLIPIVMGKVLQHFQVTTSIVATVVILLSLPSMNVIPMLVPEQSKEKPFAVGVALMTIVISLLTIPVVQWVVWH